MPFLPPNQQRQSTEGKDMAQIWNKMASLSPYVSMPTGTVVLGPAAVAAAGAAGGVNARLRALARRAQWNLVARRPGRRRSAAAGRRVLSVQRRTAAAGHVVRARHVLEWRPVSRRRGRRVVAARRAAARQQFLHLVRVEDGVVLRWLATAGAHRARHDRVATAGRAVTRRRAHHARRPLLPAAGRRTTAARVARALVLTGPRTHRRVGRRRLGDVGDRRQRSLVHPRRAVDVFSAAGAAADRRGPGDGGAGAGERRLVAEPGTRRLGRRQRVELVLAVEACGHGRVVGLQLVLHVFSKLVARTGRHVVGRLHRPSVVAALSIPHTHTHTHTSPYIIESTRSGLMFPWLSTWSDLITAACIYCLLCISESALLRNTCKLIVRCDIGDVFTTKSGN